MTRKLIKWLTVAFCVTAAAACAFGALAAVDLVEFIVNSVLAAIFGLGAGVAYFE